MFTFIYYIDKLLDGVYENADWHIKSADLDITKMRIYLVSKEPV